MDAALRADADRIIERSIMAVLPDEAVRRALADFRAGPGRTVLIAAGKAAWRMASAAAEELGDIDGGILITKYGHVGGRIPGVRCFEAGHPVPDENGFAATREALDAVRGLGADDTVVFLLSGGGSALFELPLVPAEELRSVTERLLASGADITEINTVRKRLSAVKGGRFALACAPARVYCVILSDVIGDAPDVIASGPACPDTSTCAQAAAVAEKYGLELSPAARELLNTETPKALQNVEIRIGGSVRELCSAAAAAAEELGYEPVLLTDRLCCEAAEAGRRLAELIAERAAADRCGGESRPAALIAGGETVVRVRGRGKGGRNQELALAAAPGLAGIGGAAVFSVGSDGTDGPTDAAGGYVDHTTLADLERAGVSVGDALRDNDSYRALAAAGGLIVTGPTGTNVNDVAVALLRR